jgi:hypothetical protein
MKRFFISPHPTFGSYKNPIPAKIEKSPYYYWWLALTLNDDYLELCSSLSEPACNPPTTSTLRVAVDFGDVSYIGSKYEAFTNWWCEKLSNQDTKGTYLFAEPITASKLELINDKKQALAASQDASSLLINIPKHLNRRQIDKALDALFKKELTFEKGRQTRNPSRSNARYSLSKPVMADSLKSAFDIIEAEREALAIGKKLSNVQLADKVGLKVEISEATRAEQDGLAEYEIYLLSTTVSRKKKLAKTAIANAAKGIFP